MIECVPTVSAEVLSDPVPPDSATVPNVALAFLKVTVPVGVPPEDEVTVAEKVMFCPNAEGVPLDATEEAVEYLLTVTVVYPDTDVAYTASEK